MAQKEKGKLFVVSSPSGAGKTSVVNEALVRLQKKYDIDRVITYTSRPSRQDEVNGKDYFFLSREEFEQKIKSKFFLEFTEYTEHFYGSPKSILSDLELGKSRIMVIDIEGAKRISSIFHDAVLIWLTPPDMKTLKDRLIKRGTESESQMESRLIEAEKEMKEAPDGRLFRYTLVNDIFEKSVVEFIKVIEDELGHREIL